MNRIFKIKESVDLYLVDEIFVKAYFINSRVSKKFKVSKELIFLFENLDGKKNLRQIYKEMVANFGAIEEVDFLSIIELAEKSGIIVECINNHILDERYRKRFDRQLNYFADFLGSEIEAEKAQQRLKESRFVIFGCGAIGGNLAVEMVMAGVEKVTLVDYDHVEESDISRHIYFSEKNIGRKKVYALKDYLISINSSCDIECIDMIVRPNTNINNIITKATFVINTLDEPYIGYTSAKISRICVKYNIPHYIAGGFDAHLASTGEIIIPYVTPCVECYATYFKKALEGWKPKPHPVKERYKEIGGWAAMSLFSTSFAGIEIIKFICGLVNVAENYKTRGEFMIDDMNIIYIHLQKNPNCKVCGVKYE